MPSPHTPPLPARPTPIDSNARKAANALDARVAEARRLLAQIESQLADKAATPRPDWGHVGDVTHVVEILSGLVR